MEKKHAIKSFICILIIFIALCFMPWKIDIKPTVQQPIQETKEENKKEYKITSTSLSGPEIELIQHPSEGTLFMLDKRNGDISYYIQSTDSTEGYWERATLNYPELVCEEYPHPNRYQLIFADGVSDVIISQQLLNERDKFGWKKKSSIWNILKKDKHGHWHKHDCFFKDTQKHKL